MEFKKNIQTSESTSTHCFRSQYYQNQDDRSRSIADAIMDRIMETRNDKNVSIQQLQLNNSMQQDDFQSQKMLKLQDQIQQVKNEISQLELQQNRENGQSTYSEIHNSIPVQIQTRKTKIVNLEKDYIRIRSQSNQLFDLVKKAETQVSDEFKQKIEKSQENIKDIQEQKNKITQELETYLLNYNINLEHKALLKEDLQGKLVYRAELVAYQEDLQQLLDDFNQKYPNDYKYIIEEQSLQNSITSQKEEINKLKHKKQQIHKNQESIVQNLYSTNQSILNLKNKLEKLAFEKQEQITKFNNEIDEIENFINFKFVELKLPQIDTLFVEAFKGYNSSLERKIFAKQLEYVEDQQEELQSIFQKTCQEYRSKIQQAVKFQGENSKEVQGLAQQFQDIINTRNRRNDILENWKFEANKIIEEQQNQAKNQKIDWSENLNTQNLVDFFRDLIQERKLTSEQSNIIENSLYVYLNNLSEHEKFLRSNQFETDQTSIQIFEFQDQQRVCLKKKQDIDEEYKLLESSSNDDIIKLKTSEQSLTELNILFDEALVSEAEVAFKEYLQQQQDQFDNLARTYGNKAAQQLKQQHYQQFITVMQKTRKDRIEKYQKIQKEQLILNQQIKKQY